MERIPKYLIEAYTGYYEDEELLFRNADGTYSKAPNNEESIRRLILRDTPKDRLEIYLIWNGILGYSNTIFDIATTQEYAAS